MWIGNFLARVIWTVAVIIEHAYITRTKGMVPTEAVGLVRPLTHKTLPTDWSGLVLSFAPRPDEDDDEDDFGRAEGEVFAYVNGLRHLIREVWGMKDFGLLLVCITVQYAYSVQRWGEVTLDDPVGGGKSGRPHRGR